MDEKIFKGYDSSIKFVRRKRSENSKNKFTYFKRNNHSVNVFGFITKKGKGGIYLAKKTNERNEKTGKIVPSKEDGGFNNASYCKLLENKVLKDLSKHIIGDKLIYVQDNAGIHVAKNKENEMYVEKVFNKVKANVEFVEWPPLSPDLNPIENVWSVLMIEYRKILNIADPPRNSTQTFTLIKKAWENLNNDLVIKIFNSFEKKLNLVRSKNGCNKHKDC